MAEKARWVRRPLVQYDARGLVDTHGKHVPVRIVVHTTESHDEEGLGDLRGIANYWSRTPEGLGAHVIVDKDGNSALCGDPSRVMYAVKGRNTGTFHIELIGRAKFLPTVWWLRLAQLNKAAKWIAWVNYEYPLVRIVFDADTGVSGHRDQPNQTHWDPGTGFPMRYLIRRAQQFRANGWT